MKPAANAAKPYRVVVAACLATAALYTAPTPADPMRPLSATAVPPGSTPIPNATGNVNAAAPSGAAPLRGLVAIRQDSNGERSALFGDRWVRAGDRFTAPEGETWVVSISASAIELEQGRVRSHHHLLPPLLPPQWPARPAELQPTATPPRHAPHPTPLPAQPRAPHSAASSAQRTERP